jgi:hypothetical protein
MKRERDEEICEPSNLDLALAEACGGWDEDGESKEEQTQPRVANKEEMKQVCEV